MKNANANSQDNKNHNKKEKNVTKGLEILNS